MYSFWSDKNNSKTDSVYWIAIMLVCKQNVDKFYSFFRVNLIVLHNKRHAFFQQVRNRKVFKRWKVFGPITFMIFPEQESRSSRNTNKICFKDLSRLWHLCFSVTTDRLLATTSQSKFFNLQKSIEWNNSLRRCLCTIVLAGLLIQKKLFTLIHLKFRNPFSPQLQTSFLAILFRPRNLLVNKVLWLWLVSDFLSALKF